MLSALRCALHLKAKRGILAAPLGEAESIAFAVPRIIFSQIFHIRCALPISGVRIAAPVVLGQHKEDKRIGEVRTSIRCASPIVIELAY
jgi:hypothetical protein